MKKIVFKYFSEFASTRFKMLVAGIVLKMCFARYGSHCTPPLVELYVIHQDFICSRIKGQRYDYKDCRSGEMSNSGDLKLETYVYVPEFFSCSTHRNTAALVGNRTRLLNKQHL